MAPLPKTFKAAVITKAGSQFEIVDKPLTMPTGDQVLIKVEACGVCHSDVFTQAGYFPGIKYPRVPGHEAVGLVVALGERVKHLKVGARVGAGWNGYYCGNCSACRRGIV